MNANAKMSALVYQGAGKSAWSVVPMPAITAPGDAIVKIGRSTICGSDLHILKGDVPSAAPGRILGHEGIGTIESVGPAVSSFKVGDRVLISCITSCGNCASCKKGMYSHCERGGGWILGNTIDGTQAEYVRIPFADNSLYNVPKGADEDALVMLSDILPTGFECGVLNGAVKPGDVVAIVGAGPVGLSALLTAQLYSPAELILIDLDDNRLAAAMKLGATKTINSTDGKAAAAVLALTQQRGVDVAIEAVGQPSSFEICQDIVAAGGHIANIGVHGKPVTLKMEKLWDRNITLTTRLVDTVTLPLLMKSVLSGRLQPAKLITHTFKLSDTKAAYETFGNAAREKALKVILRAG
jgi:alcohol dehydrogenase